RETRALLDQGENRLGDRGFEARQRLRLDAVDAGDADDLLNEIRLALDVRTPGRRRYIHALARALDREAELPENLLRLVGLHVETRQPRHFRPREFDDPRSVGHSARHHRLARLATTEIDDHLRREI